MPMTQNYSLTQEAVDKLSQNLEEMPKNMRQFTSDIRALYSDQAVGGQSEAAVRFRKIRDDTRQDAMVYLKCILPATTNFIRSVKEYFENYDALLYEDWCNMLADIVEETKTHKDHAQTVLDLHQNIMIPLNKRKDEMQAVMTELVNMQSAYDLSEGSAHENVALAIASEEQCEINKDAARTVAETLILALGDFIEGLQEVARFFQIIEREMRSFEGKSEGDNDRHKESHYTVIKESAKKIRSLCVAFHGTLPDIRSDLEALPSEDTDQNYVDKWLEKQLADNRSQKELKDLLEAPSVTELVDTERESITKAPISENIKPSAIIMHVPGKPKTTLKNKPPPSRNESTSTPV